MKTAFALFCLLVFTPAYGAEIVIRCTADFSKAAMGVMNVEISRMDKGNLRAQVNGELANNDTRVTEQPVRPNLDFRADFGVRNDAEGSLRHIQALMDGEDTRDMMKIPFDLGLVRRMRTYDLLGKTNKFGGAVLMEAYDADGRLLGRVLRVIMANGCF
jgi:hypothetical protein